MATIFVTGGAGFIGSHVARELAHAGHVPVTFDNLSRGHREAVRFGPLEVGDVRDRGRVDAALREHRPDAIIHLAGLIAVGESVVDPGPYYDVNLGGAITLLEAARAAGIERFVFSSTAAVYGPPDTVPIPVSHPQRPTSPYGHTKAQFEHLLDHYRHAYGLRGAALRYFNAAGASPDGLLAERHEPETHLLPIVLEVVTGKRSHLSIFGTDYDTPDGTAIRDYVHVTDLARAHVSTLERLADGPLPFAFNLGSGRGHSVLEVVAAVESITGSPVNTIAEARRPGDVPRLIADPTLAQTELGWKPRYDLTDMVEHALGALEDG